MSGVKPMRERVLSIPVAAAAPAELLSRRRVLLALPAWMPALVGAPAFAQSTGSGRTLVMAVNEGVTYRVSDDEIRGRYAAISTDLTRLLGATVQVQPVGHYPTLRQGLAERRYDIALVHPAHLSIQAIKGSGYKLVVVTKGFQGYAASFLIRADSTLKSLADLRGRRLGAPDEDSITSWMARATMRDALGSVDQVQMQYTRYQDAVPFMVEHTFTHAGATASGAVIKAWQAQGGKILAKSKAVPIKHVLVAPTLAGQAERVRDYFVGLDGSDEGKRKLVPIGINGYAPYDEAELLKLGTWLGL